MIEMTDERAAEVLAAHNAWRRYDGFPGEPGSPPMGDPTEIGRAIDHVVSRFRSQPPAEAQPVALDYVPGELDRTAPENIWLQIDTSSDNSGRQDPWPGADGVTWQDESVGGLEIQYVRADLVSPPSVPVGVDGFDKRFAEMLLGILSDVQDELGFTDEDKLCANGSEEIVAEIRELKRVAALAQQPAAVECAAMKEETLEHQLEHCDGKDCTCAAYGECECACGADWTPAEVYLLRDQVDALSKDAERIRWLAANMRRIYGRREVGGYELPDIATVESYRESCDPQHLREAIDAAIAMATVAVATGEPQREDQPE